MERGVYFDAWFPRMHNYHPSLPARRLRMLDDLVDYRATMLVWAALGGGSISLPYLEEEAFGEVPARYRFYGYMNDAELIKECQKRAIKVFGVVFECQGWEFPVELNENEDRILALNELRGTGKQGWLGLREFSANRYPNLWPSFENYFPNGLTNSAGESVTDILEECATRDIHGEPCHSKWVECPDREHFCYNMDRNNPVWREYLKAIIRIQIDAGVDGVELDEADTPLTAIRYGGCFCRDCMSGFRDYLRALPADKLPSELAGTVLTDFHYGKWLLDHGHDFSEGREAVPLFWHYLRYQQRAIAGTFAELADYAREYARSKGREVLVSGNFFRLARHYHPVTKSVDVMITEMFDTSYKQPAWLRYCAGFAGEKPLVAVSNPYGGVGPELLPRLEAGKSYDQYRMMTYEAAALGVNMSVPYGAWMGSVIEDAFYPPHDVAVECQSFIADHPQLYSNKTVSETAVVFSSESDYLQAEIINELRYSSGRGTPFWTACNKLVEGRLPYDVVMFADGDLLEDEAPELADLSGYRTLVLPACSFLTARQADLIESYANAGGKVLVLGPVGSNLPDVRVQRLLGNRNVALKPDAASFDVSELAGGPQTSLDRTLDCALNLQKVDQGVAIHIIRYDYDEARDIVPVLPDLQLRVRLPAGFRQATCFSADRALEAKLTREGEDYVVALRNVSLYGVVLLGE